MSDTHRMVTVVCDGDRRPNAAREYMTVEDCERAYRQKVGDSAGQAHS